MELLAPVGNWTMLTAAVEAGCDAVYFGVKGFNMRAAACNFELSELKKVVEYCHEHKVKAYCTVNVILFEKELEELDNVLMGLKEAKVDAVICWDLAVVRKCKEIGLEIHLSTQASVSNSVSAKQWKELGVSRIVLARECSLEDAREIKEKSGMEIEMFVHGARCISLSGRCFMSWELFGKSANRGECWQPCRREWKVVDPEEGREMKVENNFVMSPKDLCALPILDKLQFVDSFKIEGRNRDAYYVKKVVSVYRRAIDAISEGKFGGELVKNLMLELREVYNKDFSCGYFVDYPHHSLAGVYGSKATVEKVQLGKIGKYFVKVSVMEFKVECEEFMVGDKLLVEGPTTGCMEVKVLEIHDDSGIVEKGEKGMVVSVKVPDRVREGDKVYLVKERGEIK